MPPARRPTSAARRPAAGVRWDRVGRVALVLVLGGVLLAYVGPVASYVRTWQESRARQAELRTLKAEHARLLARRRALLAPQSLEREARSLGMVRQGERAFVVQGLPAGD